MVAMPREAATSTRWTIRKPVGPAEKDRGSAQMLRRKVGQMIQLQPATASKNALSDVATPCVQPAGVPRQLAQRLGLRPGPGAPGVDASAVGTTAVRGRTRRRYPRRSIQYRASAYGRPGVNGDTALFRMGAALLE